jgi:hypothetical protein
MKIIVYDDNPDYGGHQIMACHGVEALAADPSLDVAFMFNPSNEKLADRLPTLGNLQPLEAPCTTRKFQGLLNRISKKNIAALAKAFQSLEADLILCIQGEIEDSSQAVLAVRRAGIECVSYLAIPHPMQLMGAKFGGLRDRLNQYLFNQPDRYIAISESMKALLIERGVEKPISVVPNGIPAPPFQKVTAHGSRLTLGLIGRVEFNQKQQDFMVRTFCDFPQQFANCQLVMAGSGPDEEKLRHLIEGKENITLLPWQADTEAFYDSIDFLLIPSRFEGVPLVMLEALARGIPTLGSRRDGMRDLLPEAWLFDPGNGKDLATVFSKVRNSWPAVIGPVQKKVAEEMTLESFKRNFHRAVVRK